MRRGTVKNKFHIFPRKKPGSLVFTGFFGVPKVCDN
nr:MAG TPA: hypothetical protein [Caudoviricetes sp.]